MSKHWWLVVGTMMGTVVLGGCGKVKRLVGSVSEEAATKTAEAATEGSDSVKAAPPLIAGAAPGPAGIRWERADQAGVGSFEVPTGEGWTKERGAGLQVSNSKLDITVMVQSQPNVPADARKEYLSSLVDVNKRDAPKYQLIAQDEGGVNAHVAGRVDGKFDNGTAYATRDYVLFVKNSALALMVRGPVPQAGTVQAIADHIASSYQ